MTDFQILAVCTANICRSPATAAFLRHDLTGATTSSNTPVNIAISSAGTHALPDHPGCEMSRTLVAEHLGEAAPGPGPGSRQVTGEIVDESDLILGLDRSHRGVLARLSPRSRPRTFTLRQAACLSEYVREILADGQFPEGAPPLPAPEDPRARLTWLVSEMDAARGVCTIPVETEPVDSDSTDAGADTGHDPLDVPDPHVIGFDQHPPVLGLIRTTTADLSRAIRAVLEHAG